MQKSSSLEEVSQRNIEDLTESSESERTSVRKPRVNTNTEASLRDRRRWGDQVLFTFRKMVITFFLTILFFRLGRVCLS